MIIQFIQLLLIALIGSKNEPVHNLHKKKEPKNFKGLNWTFILLTLVIVFFFLSLFILMLFGFSGTESGMQYNHFGDLL